jgi:hypothetical protein
VIGIMRHAILHRLLSLHQNIIVSKVKNAQLCLLLSSYPSDDPTNPTNPTESTDPTEPNKR